LNSPDLACSAILSRKKTDRRAKNARRPPIACRLRRIRESLGEYSFSAQYLQSPVPFGGALIKAAWLRYDEPGMVPQRFSSILQSWDTASKPTELADFSVCPTWGVQNKHIYLLNVFRKRLDISGPETGGPRAGKSLVAEYYSDRR
jgi:hypothetical protein